MLERYLDQLGLLGDARNEVRQHLEDSIQARLELGQELETATKEALTAFGERAKLRIATETPDSVRPRLKWLACGFVVMAVGYVLMPFITSLRGGFLGLQILVVTCVLGFAVASFRTGRPRPAAIAAIAMLGAFLVGRVESLFFIDLNAFGGSGSFHVWNLTKYRNHLDEAIHIREKESSQILAEAANWRSHGEAPLKVPGGYRAPIIDYRLGVWTASLPTATMGIVADRDEAVRNWKDLRWYVGTADLVALRSALNNAPESFLRRLLSLPISDVYGGLVTVSFAVAVDGVFGALGLLVLTLRRRRHMGGLCA